MFLHVYIESKDHGYTWSVRVSALGGARELQALRPLSGGIGVSQRTAGHRVVHVSQKLQEVVTHEHLEMLWGIIDSFHKA